MAKRGGGSGRKYVRDSIGRFSSTGATARGGRLKTASGKKRAVQTVKAKTGGKPAGALKAKPRSEGQKYAGRIKAGKDLKRSQSVASQKKFVTKTQKRLDAAPLAQSRAAANKISKSPRQLNKDEKIARDVMTDKRFKSDRQRVTEMQRRGVKPGTDAVGLVANVRSKQGGGTTGRVKPSTAARTSKSTAGRAAKAKYQAATSSARKASMLAGGRTSSKGLKGRTDSGAANIRASVKNAQAAKRKVRKMEETRGAKKKSVTANSARATGKLARPVAKGNIRRTGGRLGPKNTIKPGPKSPRTKMNRAIDNVIKKGKALKGSADKLRGVKKQADALRGRMLKEDKGRLGKALSKPSVTDKRSRDYGGRLTKGARGQDSATGGKKSNAKPAAAKRRGAVGKISEAKAGRIVARLDAQRGRKALPGRRNANFARTYERSRQFILKPSTAALKKGKPISVNESVQKAVANAANRRKAKPAAAKRRRN